MENNIGILVLGHGSSLPYNKEVVSAVADMIAKSNENMVVQTAFLNVNNPTIQEGIKEFSVRDPVEIELSKGVNVISSRYEDQTPISGVYDKRNLVSTLTMIAGG